MAYATTNPPTLRSQAISGSREWVYSTTDDIGVVNTSNYFSNGFDLGMKAGDTVAFTKVTSASNKTPADQAILVVMSASSTLGVDTSDGQDISTADTD